MRDLSLNLSRSDFSMTKEMPDLVIVRHDSSRKVALEAQLQTWPVHDEGERGVEVHIICVVHQILMPFQVEKVSEIVFFADNRPVSVIILDRVIVTQIPLAMRQSILILQVREYTRRIDARSAY